MAKMSSAGKYHGHTRLVTGGDRVLVLFGAAWLNDSAYTRSDNLVGAVTEREKSVRADDGAPGALTSLFNRNAAALKPIHLTGTRADEHLIFDHTHGIGF